MSRQVRPSRPGWSASLMVSVGAKGTAATLPNLSLWIDAWLTQDESRPRKQRHSWLAPIVVLTARLAVKAVQFLTACVLSSSFLNPREDGEYSVLGSAFR